MRAQLSNHDYEQLSAYIDNQLAPNERRKLEERLRALPELKAALDDMMRTHMLLRSAPRRRAPRNFTLTPAMVGEHKQRRGWSLNLFPALSFASAVATLALVGVLAFQMLPGRQAPVQTASEPVQSTLAAAAPVVPSARNSAQSTAPSVMAAPAAESQAATDQPGADRKAPPSDTGGQDNLNPPVIAWEGQAPGAPNMGSAGGMGGGAGGDGGGGQGPSVGQLLSPPVAAGKGGGGAAGSEVYGMGGGGAGGNIVLPPQAADSLNTQSAGAPTTTPVKPDPAISGTGPILGVPSASEGGQITEQKALMGQANTAQADQNAPAVEAAGEQPAQNPRTVLGLPLLTALEILLAVIAVATAAAAFFVRRRAA